MVRFEGMTADQPMLAHWWKVFGDPVLDRLVDEARNNNNSLQIAGLRILEARAQLGVATGSLYPQSQVTVGEATHLSPPDNTGVASHYWQYRLGASIAWELDFWGKFRRGVEAADAAFLASVEAYQQALVLLTAQVVESYTAVRVTEEQLRIARENIELQQRSHRIAEVQYLNGETSELDMQQANTLLLSTRATVPALEAQLTQARNALSVLLGKAPGSVDALLTDGAGIAELPPSIAVGIPAEVLRGRPDVRQAELLALAQNAQVGVAEAGLYPSFSLNGSIGLAAGSPGDSSFGSLFESDAFTYSVGPSFVWPFFNYGRIKNSIRVEDARLQQALVNYHEIVLQAAREAENAMAALIGARRQTTILAETVRSAKRSAALSTLRYQEGFSDYQRVLDSQQALFNQEQRYITIKGSAVSSLTTLCKALGGGWQDLKEYPVIQVQTIETMERRTDWGALLQSGKVLPDKDRRLHSPAW